MYSAILLERELKSLGYMAKIVNQVMPNDSTLYIIYGSPNLKRIPPNYIVYQIEIAGTKHFNWGYYQLIQNAKAVWEYSMGNAAFYHQYNPNIYFMPPLTDNNHGKENRTIPHLFYGWIEGSNRRKWLLTELSKHVKITTVTNKTGVEMWRMLQRTWTVINIHYYNGAPMELFRINEALSHGCNVVSEGYLEGIDCANSVEEFVEKLKNPTRPIMPNNKQYLEKFLTDKNSLLLLKK
jgi:hypothetical protein